MPSTDLQPTAPPATPEPSEEGDGERTRAFETLVSTFAEDYDEQVATSLARAAHSAGRWADLLRMANAWLDRETDPNRKLNLALQLGKWYGEELGRPEYSAPYFNVAFECDPQSVRVMRYVASVRRVRGELTKAGSVLKRALALAATTDERKLVLVELGELVERDMGRPEFGCVFYRQALLLDPNYERALQACERVHADASAPRPTGDECGAILETLFAERLLEADETHASWGLLFIVGLAVLMVVAVFSVYLLR